MGCIAKNGGVNNLLIGFKSPSQIHRLCFKNRRDGRLEVSELESRSGIQALLLVVGVQQSPEQKTVISL